MKHSGKLLALLLMLATLVGFYPVRHRVKSASLVTGGPVVLMGIDAEDGGPGGHGPISVYVSVVNDILSKATNGGSGILVIGGNKAPFDGPTTFWNAIAANTGVPVTYVNGAANISSQSFSGFKMIAVVSDVNNTGNGLTQAENDALATRAADIAAFVNNGGGLLGFSSVFFGGAGPYAYLGSFAPVVVTFADYDNITPTADGTAVGISNALDICCWHNIFTSYPSFLKVLATNANNYAGGPTGVAAALGGAQVVITNEVCNNGIDDDNDGLTDESDPDCQVCGDGNIDPGEECDDGNNIAGDGCFKCKLENQPPVAVCKDVTVAAGTDCKAAASIDNGSFDPNGDAITVVAAPAGPYPLGTTTVTLTVTDSKGLSSTCTAKVTVVDGTAPTIGCSVATSALWPPNHDLVNVGLTASARDNCAASPTIGVRVYADEDDEEATGDGNHSPDAKNLGPGTLRLRAERKGDGDGRVYLIVTTASDGAGNVSRCVRTVVVPHGQSQAAINSVNAQAAAAASYFNSNGVAPPGFYVVGDGAVIGPKQ